MSDHDANILEEEEEEEEIKCLYDAKSIYALACERSFGTQLCFSYYLIHLCHLYSSANLLPLIHLIVLLWWIFLY